jgi:hypothetical protein
MQMQPRPTMMFAQTTGHDTAMTERQGEFSATMLVKIARRSLLLQDAQIFDLVR